ncbi:ski-like protein [Brachyhypopomus gauderio]|uniref:ski-like protein n=1 Tax=Brachyhypopomus gauderio TaxID=698409 RepID=UPI0040428DDC
MASAQTNVKTPFKEQISFHSSMKRLYREQLEDAPIKKRVMAEMKLKRRGVELLPRATRVKQEQLEDEPHLEGMEGQEAHVAMVGKALDLSPGLKNTLAQFTLSSQSSLGGPAAFSSKTGQEPSLPAGVAPLPSPSVLGVGPLLVPCDSSTELTHSVLEGESISCFVVGGEKRLCLPQVLNSVLRDFSLQQINAVCDELYVYCSRCDASQLHILKVLGILPFNAPSCGLITLTDAQRLCNSLLRQGTELPTLPLLKDAEAGFQVEHQCLGQCQGLFLPHFYVQPDSPCVQCVECQLLFSPQNFVMHSHKSPDKRTCHWGFDSAKWSCYLQLSRRHEGTAEEPQLKQLLDDVKKKFSLELKRPLDKKVLDNDGQVRKSSPDLCPASHKACDKEKDRKGKDQSSLGFCHLFSDIKEEAGHAAVIHPSYYLYPYDKVVAPNVSLQKDGEVEVEVGVEMLGALIKQHYNRKTHSHDRYTGSDLHVTSSSYGEEAKSGNMDEMRQRSLPPLAVTLETGSSGKEDDKERIVLEIIQMYSRQQEKLNTTLHRQQQLEMELEAMRGGEAARLRQLSVEHSELQSELEAVHTEHAEKLGEVQQEQRELEQRLEQLRQQGCTCQPREQEPQYTAQLCELRCRLEQAEMERQQLQDELQREREAREKLELLISQLQKQIMQSASRGCTSPQNLANTTSPTLEATSC